MPMLNTSALVPYTRLLALMDRAEEAVLGQDLDEVCRLGEEITRLLPELAAPCFENGDCPPSDWGLSPFSCSSEPQTAATLEALIRRALDRAGQLQARIVRWLEETGADLGKLHRGAAAVRSYAMQDQAGPLFVGLQG